jgi:putative CocE/NonD family hydrolase
MKTILLSIARSVSMMLIASVSLAAEDLAAKDATNVVLHWGVRIPMRDGIHLNGTLYTPGAEQTPAPCILMLTPYIADRYHDDAMFFAAQGLPFLAVDARGRGNSEGTFRPMIQEANDGYDLVEWLARQSYCNGKVAMWGYSYGGYDQWATVKELPPHLASLVPVAAHYSGFDWPLRNNVFSDAVTWLTSVSGSTSQDRLTRDQTFWSTINRQWLETGTSFKELDRLAGVPSAVFQEWLSHPEPDAYWDAQAPTPEQYAQIAVPILTITGSYDGLQLGALAYYRQHIRYGNADAKNRHYLIIGPWDHGGTYKPRAQFGGLKFGPESLLDLHKLQREWYAWTMQNGPKPEFLRRRVAYYVIGAETWRYADSLEAVTAHSSPYFLHSTSNPTDVFQSGSLNPRPPAEGPLGTPDHYLYDPRDVGRVELQSTLDPASWVDQRMIYASSGKQLVYHTAPFEKDTEISGFFKLSAWFSIDQPDTDFLASVYEISVDGSSILLANDLIRARYRESLREPRLIHTREPLRFDFERFTFVSRQIKKGSRLRLVVSPTDHYPYIYWEKNYNSGRVVTEESMKDARPATVSLYHDRVHPSVLYVPFGQAESPGESTAPASSLTSAQ